MCGCNRGRSGCGDSCGCGCGCNNGGWSSGNSTAWRDAMERASFCNGLVASMGCVPMRVRNGASDNTPLDISIRCENGSVRIGNNGNGCGCGCGNSRGCGCGCN